MSKYHPTARDFALFKAECKRLIVKWSVVGWTADYALGGITTSANIATDAAHRHATIRLGTSFDIPVDRDLIVRLARHEIAHLIVSELDDLAFDRFVTRDQLRAASETVANRLAVLLP